MREWKVTDGYKVKADELSWEELKNATEKRHRRETQVSSHCRARRIRFESRRFVVGGYRKNG